jgi:hypothetical protein
MSLCDALYASANACSTGRLAGWVPAPRPMNQTTTVPPLGPGWPCGSGVLISVGTGVGEASAFRDAGGEATMS